MYEFGLNVPEDELQNERIKLFQKRILKWYDGAGRHYLPWRIKGLSSYYIVVSEVLLQRTKAETVNKYYFEFVTTFPNWETLATASLDSLEIQLRPFGLFRQRAKRLKDLADEMVKRKGVFPREKSELIQIPLLGQYIVNSIQLQIFNRPSPLLDVNMARVLERQFGKRKLADIRYDPYLQSLAIVVTNHKRLRDINWAMLDFAAIICKARKPLCEICVLRISCKEYNKS